MLLLGLFAHSFVVRAIYSITWVSAGFKNPVSGGLGSIEQCCWFFRCTSVFIIQLSVSVKFGQFCARWDYFFCIGACNSLAAMSDLLIAWMPVGFAHWMPRCLYNVAQLWLVCWMSVCFSPLIVGYTCAIMCFFVDSLDAHLLCSLNSPVSAQFCAILLICWCPSVLSLNCPAPSGTVQCCAFLVHCWGTQGG